MKRNFFVIVLVCAMLVVSLPLTAVANEEFELAVEKYGQGKFQEVIDILTGYVEKRPEPAAYWMIGYSLYKLKRFDEADNYFKSAYLIDPEFSPKQIEAFAPGLEEVYKDIEKKLKEEFEREVIVPEEAPPEMPTFEARPEELAPAEQPPEEEQVAGTQQEAVPAEQPEPAVPTQPGPTAPVQPEVAPPAEQPAPVTPQVQPPISRPPQPMPRAPQPIPIPEGMAALSMMLAGFGMIAMIVSLVFYIYFSLCFFLMAKKLGVAAPWLAFIPIVQIYTFVAVAGKPWWWIILLFIPLVGAILSIYLWMCIAENMGKNKWLGLLILVPVVNLIIPGWFAFSKSAASVARRGEDEFGGEAFGGAEDFGSGADFGSTDFGGEPEPPREDEF